MTLRALVRFGLEAQGARRVFPPRPFHNARGGKTGGKFDSGISIREINRRGRHRGTGKRKNKSLRAEGLHNSYRYASEGNAGKREGTPIRTLG